MIVGIIPARYDSHRFPGKVLARIDEKTIIQHVYERASACRQLDRVVVATDDQRVVDEVETFGGQAYLTSPSHRNGTERCAELARQLDVTHCVNIQGDEPLIEPNQIDTVCHLLQQGAEIATLKKQISSQEDLLDPNIVKVVTNL
ncbi:MAG: NTP transferase domain-containing protein, partial [Bacteroidota bacterium]